MTFGSLGYGPRAQSVLHCHGVLVLRQGPWTPAWTEAVQNESQLQEDTSRVAAERKPAPGGHEQGGSWQCRNGVAPGGHEQKSSQGLRASFYSRFRK